MAKRGGRHVFLGVQWARGSWEDVPPLCDLLIGKAGKRPLLWNFPALSPETSKQTRKWLEKAVGSRLGLDIVAAMGFAGACNPVLTVDELEKEISWGVENPWGTGMAQLLDARPALLIPRLPDLRRTDALKIYEALGFTALGIPNGRALAWYAVEGVDCFTYVRIGVADGRRNAKLPRGGDVLLMLDLSGNVTRESLDEALARNALPWLAPEGTPSPLSTSHPAGRDNGGLTADGLDWSAFPDPALRQAIASHAGSVRKKRKRNDDYRALLVGLSLTSTPEQDDDPSPSNSHGSQLVAQMLGEVILAGSGFDVKMTGGRFTGIAKAGRDYLPARPARSYLRVGGKTLHFRTANSFSFEGDRVIGLREVLGIDSMEKASLSIEYSFCEGCPMVEIAAEVQWPELAPRAVVEEHAPLVICMRELGRGEEAVVQCVAPDGSAFSAGIEGASWQVLPSSGHRIALSGGGALVLRAGPIGATGWSLASFRVRREGRRRFLEANPFGGWSPLPSAALSGRRERFSLLVGIEE